MSRGLGDEVVGLLKELVKQISGYEDGTPEFKSLEKHATLQLKKADTMFFVNQKDIDKAIVGMGQKFMFHGFFMQANYLERAYNKYIPQGEITKGELSNRLNVVNFLLHMSERPTSQFWKNPDEFVFKEEEPAEVINWGEYLTEGITAWVPLAEDGDNSSDWSDESGAKYTESVDTEMVATKEYRPPAITDCSTADVIIDFRANREELMNTIQHSWFNDDSISMYPSSTWRDANIGILWEEYLKDQVMGLINIESCSIITEYKVMREVIWQLFEPHTSTVFELEGNTLQPKEGVTISSVRQVQFHSFMKQFTPYIELLEYFKGFEKTVLQQLNVETYKGYVKSLRSIVQPVYWKIVKIEDNIREQETTMTLLKLIHELGEIFEPLQVLKQIHDGVTESPENILKSDEQINLTCALKLLQKLHNSLRYSYSKLGHDIKLALYLESLYYYFKIIDSWLMKNDFADYSDEFVIKQTTNEIESWKMGFVLKDGIDADCLNDKIIKICCEEVLEVGRNIQLLRDLGKYNLSNENLGFDISKKESIHAEFVEKVLKELCKYYNYEDEGIFLTPHKDRKEETFSPFAEKEFKYPVICTDTCKKVTEMDKLENVVDTSDGFLMKAFESYFIKPAEEDIAEEKDLSLYEKISEITKSLFPTEFLFERILLEILKERFTISGLMVKNLLIEEYKLDKQFEFFRHVFLFADDLIFPFYRRLFKGINYSNKNWGNSIWLTSHLQDIIMDMYPEFYDRCVIDVKDYWKQCTDIISALNLINVKFKIMWPLSIIITERHMELYQEVFSSLLKLKWCLYSLDHLAFRDIEPSKTCKKQNKARSLTVMRLKFLRFGLLNILSSLQHFVFGFIYNTCLNKFELDFEKSNDLRTLMSAHADFIETLHKMVTHVLGSTQSETGFSPILHCVKLVHLMWNNISLASNEKLNDCYSIYKAGMKMIDPIVNPVYI